MTTQAQARRDTPATRHRGGTRAALRIWLLQLVFPVMGLAFFFDRMRVGRAVGVVSLVALAACLGWASLVLVLAARRGGRAWVRARRTPLLLLLVSLTLGFGIVELVSRAQLLARWDTPPRNQSTSAYSPDLGWKLIPGVEDIGAHGWRRPDYAPGRPEGRFRIVCIGDATTFGQDCPWDGAWPYQLEVLLNKNADWVTTHGRAEVVNLGVPDYGPDQALLALKKYGLSYQPSAVVFHLCVNDFADASFHHDWRASDGVARYKPRFVLQDGRLVLTDVPVPPARDLAGNLYEPGARKGLGPRSAFFWELGSYLDQRENGLFPGYQNVWPIHEAFVADYLKARPLVWALIQEMAAVCREAGSAFLVTLSPAHLDAPADAPPWRVGSARREFQQDAAAAGVAFLDCIDDYFAEGGPEKFLTRPGAHHLNAEGNALIARATLRWLREHATATRRQLGSD